MAIKFKRSFTSGFVPDPSQLEEGEIIINMADKVIYTLNDANEVIAIKTDVPKASETVAGIVSTEDQTFGGNKTFVGTVTIL